MPLVDNHLWMQMLKKKMQKNQEALEDYDNVTLWQCDLDRLYYA